MKKRYQGLFALFAWIVLVVGGGQGLAASTNNNQALHRDGTAYVKEKRITQADRQAAANRAKAKGFQAPKVEVSTGKAAPPERQAAPGKSPQADKGVKK